MNLENIIIHKEQNMTIDELIQDLEYFKSKYGNLEVKLAVEEYLIAMQEVSVQHDVENPSKDACKTVLCAIIS